MPCSPRRRIRLATVAGGLAVLRDPVGSIKTSADLTPATGARTTRFCRPRTPSPRGLAGQCTPVKTFSKAGSAPFVLRARRSLRETRPAITSRPALPRPPHPIPTFVTMANAPRSERDGGVVVLIWGNREAVYFCARDWTGSISLIRLKKFAWTRTPNKAPCAPARAS